MGMLQRAIDKLLSGRYALLMMFGTTICFMSCVSLIAVLFLNKSDEKFIAIVTFFGGYLTGAFSKMWDSYSYAKKDERIQNNELRKEETKGEVK